MMKEEISDKAAEILLSIGAVSFRFDPPYTYTSGLKSPIYLDNRLILSFPKERDQIIELYIEKIKAEIGLDKINCISGTATAAIPQASWLSDRLKLPMVYCRSSAKAHGKEKQIEGVIKKGSNVLIVEDHISTGGSSIVNAEAVRSEGGIVEFCIATTTYETETSIKAFAESNIKLFALTTGKQIVAKAKMNGVLNEKEAQLVENWFENPTKWSNE